MKNNALSCLILLGFLLVACASSGKLVVHQPPVVKLFQFRSIAVQIEPDKEKNNLETQALAGAIVEKLNKLGYFEKCLTENQEGHETTELLLKGKVEKSYHVSSTSRLVLGMFAGQANFVVNFQLIKQKNGEVLSSFRVEGKSSGGSVFAGTTDQAFDHVVNEIVNFIRVNRT